ncbi:MAG: B12-binding domain-containing radical SAM protein [Acidobacteria bacterium]|nr:B12-binding domain-containing radical SAM protein [Acidobacteriota bacterium]
MIYHPQGVRFVLTAPETESTEQGFSPWKQMVYASVPARFAPRFLYKRHLNAESYPDGTAKVMPLGLRIVEDILREHFPGEDIAVCHPDHLGLFVGPRTRAVGVAAHNPIGVAFSTGVYSNIFGSTAVPINAYESERVYKHPALRKYGPKVIVGGAGAWQIEKTNSFDRRGVDCVVVGRAESVILKLFQKADAGEELPRVVRAPEPRQEQLRVPARRSTYGVVEMTRGCGRQCAFCSPTLETRVSLDQDALIEAVRANVRAGGKCIFPVSEDIFIYGARHPFYIPNADAIVNFYESVARIPGVEYLPLSHATIAPALVNPHLIKELSRILLGKSVLKNPASTHCDQQFLSPLIGIETGSARLAAETMAGKALPFNIRDWQDIVVEGIQILNQNNWFPVCTFIVGLPGETDDDIRQSLDLLHRLRKNKILYVPSIFTPLEDTRMAHGRGLKPRELTQLQWEFILTAWSQSLNFSVVRKRSNLAWKLGMYGFYYSRVRWIHGPQFKYPAFRFAGISEEKIAPHLYLKWNGNGMPDIPPKPPRLIAKHQDRTVEELVRAQSNGGGAFRVLNQPQ